MISAKKVYEREIQYQLSHGEHRISLGLMVKEFLREGFLEETAQKRIRTLARANDHDIIDGWIKF